MCSLIIALIAPYHADHLVIYADHAERQVLIAGYSAHFSFIHRTELTIFHTIQKHFHVITQILLNFALGFVITFYRDRRHLIVIGVLSFRIFRITAAFKILCGNLHFAGCRSLGLHLLLRCSLRFCILQYAFLRILNCSAGHLRDHWGFLTSACRKRKQQSCKYCSQ